MRILTEITHSESSNGFAQFLQKWMDGHSVKKMLAVSLQTIVTLLLGIASASMFKRVTPGHPEWHVWAGAYLAFATLFCACGGVTAHINGEFIIPRSLNGGAFVYQCLRRQWLWIKWYSIVVACGLLVVGALAAIVMLLCLAAP